MKVRKNDPSGPAAREAEQKKPPRKGFTAEEADIILIGTLATPSHLISVEMKAARRWLPWLCAYSGARVNELTGLDPSDISPGRTEYGAWSSNPRSRRRSSGASFRSTLTSSSRAS
jgi:hypothetical protein